MNNFTRLQTVIIFIIILLLGEIGYVATDIYLPSLPAIAHSLHTSSQMIQLTIPFYLLGFGLSQLIYGPLSDTYGRRYIVVIGLLITIISALICTLTPDPAVLILARFLQGIGTGSGTVMARVIMIDIFSGASLIKMGSYYSIISAQILAAMPILGGYLQANLGWRSNFIFIILYSLLTLILVWKFLPETSKALDSNAVKVRVLIRNYFTLLTNPLFLGCVLCSSFALSGLLVYAAISPFLLQTRLGLSPIQYGWLALIGCAAFILGGFINSRLISYFSIKQILFFGILMMLIGGLILLLTIILHWLTVTAVVTAIFVYIIGACWIFSNTAAEALTPFTNIAGSAGALYGTVQIIIASLVTMFIALLKAHNAWILSFALLVISLLSLLIFFSWLKDKLHIGKIRVEHA